ncbi:hypothetical protein [Methylobacterium sp. J-077]|uniref:hypothetical protein n=1 Tax=Methylobacterium sp. J-077 TaxID=2836656 RepID=UPI001FBC07A3|nr:hypothetical protein [Methylobacterium sp. J-077]MCJ2126400.1 hypothetical protein [Methylobacterium sp. J-077]
MRIQSMLPWVLARKLRAAVARCATLEIENQQLIGRLTDASSRAIMPDDSSNLVGMLAEASNRGLELVARNSELVRENHHMRSEIGALIALVRSLEWRIVRFERAAARQKEDTAGLEKMHDDTVQRLALAEYRNVKLSEDLDMVEQRAAALADCIARPDTETRDSDSSKGGVEERLSEGAPETKELLRGPSSSGQPTTGGRGSGLSRTSQPHRETTAVRSCLP